MRDIINQLLMSLQTPRRSITADKRLVEDLGFDSLKVMEFIARLEDELGVTISLKRIAGVRTVGDIYKMVEEHLATQPATTR
ncbi:acyl carrier protein [Vitiosangium sp. GDMCC 1.1324]|uniref:acyl carrier protein n=1 Tax=Vitiosangium sp. (strain GDMCC 1.1324) TaxID=2138576 RepID=UPI000D3ABE11|nr:acyl carrier protein [Vitiosangium sp. GDMCC 1.1324]PTL82101.1 acyl carrier protein [Vitiosangium sp. GDMCC 1.1324]